MTINTPTPMQYYHWRRRAWRESRHAAYVQVCFRFLDARSACERIGRMMTRIMASSKSVSRLPRTTP